MFDRFSDRARKAMSYSRQEAERLGHDYIAPEHILLGILKEGGGVAATVFIRIGLSLQEIQTELEKRLVKGSAESNVGQLPFTPPSRKVLEFTIDEARLMDHNYVGTEHLLLGMLRHHENYAAQVLWDFGLRLETARERVYEITILARFESVSTNVINIAVEEVERHDHDFLGTEHVLIALCVASDVLHKLGLDPAEIRAAAEATLKSIPHGTSVSSRLPFTPALRRALKSAADAADFERSEKITCDHLVLGLLDSTDSNAAKILQTAGISLEKARQILLM